MFEARLFWYMAYRTRNITREARLFGYLAYRTRNITVEACLFRFMAYITTNLRSVSIKHTDRTNRNKPWPDAITKCTLRMCSEYELLAMLMYGNALTLLHCNSVSAFQFSEGQLFRPWLREKLSRRQQNLKI